MRDALSIALAVLVIAAQVAVGRGTGVGEVLCLGPAHGHEAPCSHQDDESSRGLVIVESHEHECDCVDVATPASLREGTRNTPVRELISGAAVVSPVSPQALPRVSVGAAARSGTCGPPPCVRTVRLLI